MFKNIYIVFVVFLCSFFFYSCTFFEESPHFGITIKPGDAHVSQLDALKIFIKTEDNGLRVVEETEHLYGTGSSTLGAEIIDGGVSFRFVPPHGGVVYLHIVGYAEDVIIATFSGKVITEPGTFFNVSLVDYKPECDRDGDSFYVCLDGEDNPNGCCDHLTPELLNHFDDKEDSVDDLEAAYTAFLSQSSGLDLFCREVLLSTEPDMIHPFTNQNFEESEPCYCNNSVDEDCDGFDFQCDDTDNDNDNWIAGRDCDDNDPTAYPGALEVAGDGIDNNCNGIIDTDFNNCEIDFDQDGFCGGDGGEDCNDRDRNIHPGLIDIPNDGIDQDCDGIYNTIILDNDVDRDQHVNINFGGDDCNDTDAGIHPGAPDLCSDGIDQDCSGEDLQCGANDLDRDGYVDIQSGGRDCDDSNPLIFPGAPDLCNDNIDQDCAGGDEDCNDDHDQDHYNILWDCDDTDPEVYPWAEEFCNGRDDDCDGLVDEGNPLYLRLNHEEAPLWCGETDEGECELGKSVCTQHQHHQYRGFECFGEIEPSDEICDNLDNDCDGEIDNGNPGGGDTCVAECGAGTLFCSRGEFICRSQDAEPETCDGEDNDCDGATDESEENPEQPLFETCYTGPEGTLWIGQCEQGLSVCEGGDFSACDGDIIPISEDCDNVGQDNDCNGIVDDFEPPTEPCNTGLLGVCAVGNWGCQEKTLTCIPNHQPGIERCDNMDEDNDCDGITDNIPTLEDECDTGLPGPCSPGHLSCSPEGIIECRQEVFPVIESCQNSGTDDDCDNTVDNVPLVGEPCNSTEHPGVCREGTYRCQNEQLVCVVGIIPGSFPENCSNMNEDDDCDGITDNIPGFGEPCSTGQPGVCADGIRSCSNSSLICTPFVTPQSLEETCNGRDDDCDGSTDEDFDLDINPENCGECGLNCGENACCEGQCVNLGTSTSHCGECGQVCASNERCFMGTCRCGINPACDSGEHCQAGTCMCGSGPACEEQETCTNGTCRCGSLICSDNENCRDTDGNLSCWCGDQPSCREGTECGEGGCSCVDNSGGGQGAVCCQGGCVDLETNTDNCGDCNESCGEGEHCTSGECSCNSVQPVFSCLENEICSGGECFCGDGQCAGDEWCTGFDTCRCGTGSSCNISELCEGEECRCGSNPSCDDGDLCCEGTCCSILIDERNCGGCGITCQFGEACASGECKCGSNPSCDEGEQCCDNQCLSVLSDVERCGGCGITCQSGETCSQGSCRCGTTNIHCGSGETCCGNECADLTEDLAHCNGCNQACEPDFATPDCNDGSCEVDSCIAPHANCDSQHSNGCEINLSNNRNHCGRCTRSCNNTQTDSIICSGSTCLPSCKQGYGNCNNPSISQSDDGCETSLWTDNACQTNCETSAQNCNIRVLHASGANCDSGLCNFTSCNQNWENCNGDRTDGCEIDLTDASHCGDCDNNCLSNDFVSAALCENGECLITGCDSEHSDCNGDPSDGCEIATDNCIMWSCKALYDVGLNHGNDQYLIDPNGEPNDDAFYAYCDMENGGWTLAASVVTRSDFWKNDQYTPENSARVQSIGSANPENNYVLHLQKWQEILALHGDESKLKVTVRRIDNNQDVTLGWLVGVQMDDDGRFTNPVQAYKGNGDEIDNPLNACVIQNHFNYEDRNYYIIFDETDEYCNRAYLGWWSNRWCNGFISLGCPESYYLLTEPYVEDDMIPHSCSLDATYRCEPDFMSGGGNKACLYKRKWYWLQ